MDEIADFLPEFIEESLENLDRLERDMIALENDPESEELLSSIFRTIHTLKGASGFLALGKIGALAHAGENLLSLLRDGTIKFDESIAEVLLKVNDAAREMLDVLEKTGAEGENEYPEIIAELKSVAEGASAPAGQSSKDAPEAASAPQADDEAPSEPQSADVESSDSPEPAAAQACVSASPEPSPAEALAEAAAAAASEARVQAESPEAEPSPAPEPSTVPEPLPAPEPSSTPDPSPAPAATPMQADRGGLFCTFNLAGYFFGIEVDWVQEVIRYQEMTPVPLANGVVTGLINLRGQIVVAMDLRPRLNLPPRDEDRLPMNVVVRDGDSTVSLLVDEIGDVLKVDASQYEPVPPTLTNLEPGLIRCVYKLEGKLLLILDTARVVALDGSRTDLEELAVA